jgi:hypothetical protein
VFIEVCPDVRIKVFEQLLDGREVVSRFDGSCMPVIAFAGLVVVAQHTLVQVNQR